MAAGNSTAVLEHSSIFPVAILTSKANATSRNVESLNTPRKPSFWLAGAIPPPWVPVTLLQLLVGSPVPTGNSSGNPVLPFFSSEPYFSFCATANWDSGRNSVEFSPSSKNASAPPTSTLRVQDQALSSTMGSVARDIWLLQSVKCCSRLLSRMKLI